jgi:hypothetical protein
VSGDERCPACGRATDLPGPCGACAQATPNPGSREALDAGCACAILDNNHGKFAPWPPDGWWITQGCPVHAPGETVAKQT